VVSNAGQILKVEINNAAPLFGFENNTEHGKSVYTMVILN